MGGEQFASRFGNRREDEAISRNEASESYMYSISFYCIATYYRGLEGSQIRGDSQLTREARPRRPGYLLIRGIVIMWGRTDLDIT